MFTAKPHMNNNKNMKDFDNIKDAVKYLNGFLDDDMPLMMAEDYLLIGKIFRK
jgi:hypothetical protein